MVTTGSYKLDAFLRRLAQIVGGEARASEESHAVDGGDSVVYLGAGYWRATIHRQEDGHHTGVSLFNPDRTAREIELVEKALPVLMGSSVQIAAQEYDDHG